MRRPRFRKGFEQGLDHIASPIVLIILALTIVSIIIDIRQGKHVLGSDKPPTGAKRAPLIFLICITAYLLVAWFDAMSIDLMSDKDGSAPHGLRPTLAWFGFLLVLSSLFGFVSA